MAPPPIPPLNHMADPGFGSAGSALIAAMMMHRRAQQEAAAYKHPHTTPAEHAIGRPGEGSAFANMGMPGQGAGMSSSGGLGAAATPGRNSFGEGAMRMLAGASSGPTRGGNLERLPTPNMLPRTARRPRSGAAISR
jgi:hypothetical protein